MLRHCYWTSFKHADGSIRPLWPHRRVRIENQCCEVMQNAENVEMFTTSILSGNRRNGKGGTDRLFASFIRVYDLQATTASVGAQ